MRGRAPLGLCALLLMAGAGAAVPAGAAIDAQTDQLRAARVAARIARERSRVLEAAAARAGDAAAATRARRAALAERIRAAEADHAAAMARAALVGRALSARREELSRRQAPIARLVAALQSLARRPGFVAIAQPGSTDDIVHVRAMLGTLSPIIAARTQAVRGELERVARLEQQAGIAAGALARSSRALEAERLALVRRESAQRAQGRALGRGALVESDRAIALGERARDIVDAMAQGSIAADTADALAALPGALPRPGEDPAALPPPAYRLPVAGRIVTGFGEVSADGVRARGLTLAVAPGAPVRAPAAGRIAYSGPFRSFGRILILDHGGGWTTLVTGLAAGMPAGADARPGALIGRAGTGDAPHVGVELRRRGTPMDVAAML